MQSLNEKSQYSPPMIANNDACQNQQKHIDKSIVTSTCSSPSTKALINTPPNNNISLSSSPNDNYLSQHNVECHDNQIINFFSNHLASFERAFKVTNIILIVKHFIKFCIILIIHYYFLLSVTGILLNIYNYIGIILIPSLIAFPSHFIYLIKGKQMNKMPYIIGVLILLLLLTTLNFVITFYPRIVGHTLYLYFFTLTNKAKIYIMLLILEGLSLFLSMILSSINSNEEIASLKVPLLS